MDRYGNTSRSMARTLRDMGIAKPYVLEGGFAVGLCRGSGHGCCDRLLRFLCRCKEPCDWFLPSGFCGALDGRAV